MRKHILFFIGVIAVVGLVLWGGFAKKNDVGKEPSSFSSQNSEREQNYLISVSQLKQMLSKKDFVLVNVHIPYEGEIAGTDYNIDYRNIDEFEKRFAKDQKIVIYCRSGAMSANAFKKLKERGFTNVYDVQGGMIAWEQMGEKLVFKK